MEYDLYHDESRENGYWHGMFLVPKSGRDYLLELLEGIRKNLDYRGVLSFKKATKARTKRFICTKSWVSIGAASLMQRKKTEPYPAFLTAKMVYGKYGSRKREYEQLERTIGTKFILFRERDAHRSFDEFFFPDEGSKVETTFRIGLKGGLHLLGSPDSPVKLSSLHFDGFEHYKRNIDRDRILGRLSGLRPYCSIETKIPIDDRSGNHSRINECQAYEDCQLLQLTDLLIGAFRASLQVKRPDDRRSISAHVKPLVERWREGYARMKNSRWFKGYCMSECSIQDGNWKFDEIVLENVKSSKGSLFSKTVEGNQQFGIERLKVTEVG